jgi:hypothetical protein
MKKISIFYILMLLGLLFFTSSEVVVTASMSSFTDEINEIGNFESDVNSDGFGDGWTFYPSKYSLKYLSSLYTYDGSKSQYLRLSSTNSSEYLFYKDISFIGSTNDMIYIQAVMTEFSDSCGDKTKIYFYLSDYGTYNNLNLVTSEFLTSSKELVAGTHSLTTTSARLSAFLYNSEQGEDLNGCTFRIDGLYIFNLTDMFGVGNEPDEAYMQLMISNQLGNEKELVNKLYENIGDFEVDENSNGLAAKWSITSQVEATYRSSHSDNVSSGIYAQRLQFDGGNTDNQGIYTNIYNAGESGDKYYYYYTDRERSGYCNWSTKQSVRIYDFNSFNNGVTSGDHYISTVKTVRSGMFTSTKENFRFALAIIDSNGIKDGCQIYYDNVHLINLTEMFGKGYEPTVSEMNNLFNLAGDSSSICSYLNDNDAVRNRNIYFKGNSNYMSVAEEAIDIWSDLVEISFEEDPGWWVDNDLYFRDCANSACVYGISGWLGLYQPRPVLDDYIWFNLNYMDNAVYEEQLLIALHEIGHSLGLDHSFKPNIMHGTVSFTNEPQDMDVACYNKLWVEEE